MSTPLDASIIKATARHVAWYGYHAGCRVPEAMFGKPRRPFYREGPPFVCAHCGASWQLVEVDMSEGPPNPSRFDLPYNQVFRAYVPTCDCCQRCEEAEHRRAMANTTG